MTTLECRVYALREVTRLLGQKDPRTVANDVYRLGLNTYRSRNAIQVDDEGLAKLAEHYGVELPAA